MSALTVGDALGLAGEELDWQTDALCAQTDPEAFFPEKGGSTREAKKVCVSCEVRVECLEYALDHDERFGIWGGLSERERRRLPDRPKTRECATHGCTTEIERRREYCDPCMDVRRATYREGRHPWQERPRPHLRHIDEGVTGLVVTATTGRDLTVVPSGRTLEDDLARADARRNRRLPPLPPEPVPAPARVVPPAPVPALFASPGQERASTPKVNLRRPRQPKPAQVVVPPPVRPPTPKVTRRRTLEPRQDWAALYRQGDTILRIANDAGVTWQTVRRHLIRAGVTLRHDRGRRGPRPPRTFTPHELAAAATAYIDGASLPDVARLLHTSHEAVSHALKSLGVRIRPRGTHPTRRRTA